jgi:hypothetical protein
LSNFFTETDTKEKADSVKSSNLDW